MYIMHRVMIVYTSADTAYTHQYCIGISCAPEMYPGLHVVWHRIDCRVPEYSTYIQMGQSPVAPRDRMSRGAVRPTYAQIYMTRPQVCESGGRVGGGHRGDT